MQIQQLLAALVAGLAFLAFGQMIGSRRSSKEAGMEPLALILKGVGLALLTFTLYRYGRERLGL